MARKTLLTIMFGGLALYCTAELQSFSHVVVGDTAPGEATVVAEVAGTGEVFAEFAHDKSKAHASVKDRYAQNGLIAMWDAVDNMGTGSHVADATTWRDLVGGHADMTFTHTPTVGADYYDLSAGGCGTSASDIGAALNNGTTTVEIVCTVNSIVNDATLFACVDGTDTTSGGAGNRLAWVRHQNTSIIGGLEYKWNAWYDMSTLLDQTLHSVRKYSFMFNHPDSPGNVVITTNGVYATTATGKTMAGNAANAWFSLGQRLCKAGSSATISDIRIHSVRVYNRILTNAERLANVSVDTERFENGAAIDLDDPGVAVVEKRSVGTVKAPVTNAKDFYKTEGLLAMFDGEDNQGTGAHVANATTWVDLTGKHAAMQFDTAPTVAARYYDLSQGGGCIKSCADIAQALQSKSATIEIVCDVRTLVDSGTLVSVVDGTGEGAGNRIVWVMNGLYGSNHQGVIGTIDYLTSGSTTPYPAYDTHTNIVRSYSMTFDTDKCRVYRNGNSDVATSKVVGSTSGNAATACLSIGQRYSQGGKSGTISNMRVYCVRVYDHILTTDEIAANFRVDYRRFFGSTNERPVGSVEVVNPDGTSTIGKDGRAVFKLTGLRPDLSSYTARLTAANGAVVSPSVTFESAAERPAAAWYEYIDSRDLPAEGGGRTNKRAINLDYASNGHVPCVEIRFQNLGGDGHGVFGAIEDTQGTYVMQCRYEDASALRYRLGPSGGAYLSLSAAEFAGVQEWVFNGPSGTFLNGNLLDASLNGVSDSMTTGWVLMGRRINAQNQYYVEAGRSRVWYFRLYSDGTLIRDLVPACAPDGNGCMFDRLSRTYYRNMGSGLFFHGPELPGMVVGKCSVSSRRVFATVTRPGAAAADLFMAYGVKHGGADPAAWEHFEQLPEGFAVDAASIEVNAGFGSAPCRYVRFYSSADGWSDSVYLPDAKVVKGLVLIVQ